MTQPGRPNRLAQATSPYLQQHQFNPVDWHPWGPEALQKAKQEDKPIFLSIGYSTCHWCHVMAHECFEDEKIAALMNEHYVNIKVDREERPDLDETYMNAVTLLTGRGGWPMSVFLTPDLKPFYAGTYFPPEDRGGLPGFPRLLLALAKSFRENRETLANLSGQVEERLKLMAEMPGEGREPVLADIAQAARRLKQDFDATHGGLGQAPKFPRALEFDLLLHLSRVQDDPEAFEMVEKSLDAMARGGIYDQVGGGFHRYTVDAAWVVPHFEKMLYDNAQLAPLYLAHHQLTGSAFSRRIAAETLDFSLREFEAPQGGFYSAWDADSEGEEGKFYVFSQEEFDRLVGPENAELARAAFGVTPGGNFEGKNILTRPFTNEELARRFSLPLEEVNQTLRQALEALFLARRKRVKPHRDEKIIVSWNGLMLSALAKGAQVLGPKIYYEAANRGAQFIFSELFRGERLFRIWSAGQVSVPAFLDDYATLANACLDLFETDFNPEWLLAARGLTDLMERHFLDPADGAYFYVAKDQEATLVRSKSLYDQVIPSGNAMAARVLWRLFRFTEEPRYQERAAAIIRRLLSNALENPWGFAYLLHVTLGTLMPPLDLTLVGDPEDPKAQALLQVIYRRFLPDMRLVFKNPADCARLEELVPSARTYAPVGQEASAYLCHHFACQPPVADPGELEKKLSAISSQLKEKS